jgi:hypothetical protein
MDARVVYFGRLPDVPVTVVEVGSEPEARVSGFAGSPTIFIDGVTCSRVRG